MRKLIPAALAACLPLLLSAAGPKTAYNRYGMTIVEKDGAYIVPGTDAGRYRALGIDLYNLKDLCVPFEAPVPASYDKAAMKEVKTEDFVYKTYPDGRQLLLSVDYAVSEKRTPVMVYIYGGGWRRGSRASFEKMSKSLAKNEKITGVRIEYSKISDGVTMEQTIGDVCDAVNFIREHAAELNVDPSHMGFMGSSAGGHLSAVAAMKFPQTKVLVGLYGAYDIELVTASYIPGETSNRYQPYYKFFNGYDPDYLHKVSPIYMVDDPSNTAVILFQGTGDITVPPLSIKLFSKALKKAGVRKLKVIEYDYVTHSIGRSWCGADMIDRSCKFIVDNIRK